MTYSVRNPFYLRISKNTVLPIYVYLDERHVDWMSDAILQHVLADLRPSVLDKLKAEANATSNSTAQKKATVDTHRGDTYQFCYFFRKTEPHSVLIKSRSFALVPVEKSITQKEKSDHSKKQKKRKELQSPPTAERPKRRKINTRLPSSDEDVEMVYTTDSGEDDDEFIPGNRQDTSGPRRGLDIELEIEEIEEKPKPVLGLTYQGFNIYGRCLCVVVEPWPVVRAVTVPPSLTTTKQLTTLPTARKETPLFLPEEPEVEEISRPTQDGCSSINSAYLNRVLDQNNAIDDDEDMGGMIEFSQVLYNIGDTRAGAINDDEDADGAILFGDADELREI